MRWCFSISWILYEIQTDFSQYVSQHLFISDKWLLRGMSALPHSIRHRRVCQNFFTLLIFLKVVLIFWFYAKLIVSTNVLQASLHLVFLSQPNSSYIPLHWFCSARSADKLILWDRCHPIEIKNLMKNICVFSCVQKSELVWLRLIDCLSYWFT